MTENKNPKENVMRKIRLEKITINIGAGESGPLLDKSKKMLEKISGKKAVKTKTRKRTTFGVPKGKPIGVKVTLRGKAALDVLKNMLKAVENKLKSSQFDANGNFSFGIDEYINIPGVKYDPDIGILGMDVCVTLERPGFRIKKRRIRPKKIGKKHRISKEDAIRWATEELGIKVTEGEE